MKAFYSIIIALLTICVFFGALSVTEGMFLGLMIIALRFNDLMK